jgi:hypothetical protein
VLRQCIEWLKKLLASAESHRMPRTKIARLARQHRIKKTVLVKARPLAGVVSERSKENSHYAIWSLVNGKHDENAQADEPLFAAVPSPAAIEPPADEHDDQKSKLIPAPVPSEPNNGAKPDWIIALEQEHPGYTLKPSKTRPYNRETMEMSDLLYDYYIVRGRSRIKSMFAVRVRFPAKAPKAAIHVPLYVKRYAAHWEPALPIERKPN